VINIKTKEEYHMTKQIENETIEIIRHIISAMDNQPGQAR
jgi:hypothetical protein